MIYMMKDFINMLVRCNRMYFSKNSKKLKAILGIGISLFFSGSVIAYADVADPWSGPRPNIHDNREIDSASMPDISFKIEENGQMSMFFHFNAQCQYQYAVRMAETDEMVTYGKGIGNEGATEQDIFYYESGEEGVVSHYVLELSAMVKRQTRFGDKLATDRIEKHIYIQNVDGKDEVSIRSAGEE